MDFPCFIFRAAKISKIAIAIVLTLGLMTLEVEFADSEEATGLCDPDKAFFNLEDLQASSSKRNQNLVKLARSDSTVGNEMCDSAWYCDDGGKRG